MHPHTLPPALKIKKTKTTPLSLLLSKITPHAKQQVPSLTSWTPPPSSPTVTLNEQTAHTCTVTHVHTLQRVCVRKCVCWCQTTCLTYTPAHAWCSKTPVWIDATLSTKMHMHPCMRAYATTQKYLCHGNYCEMSWVLCKHWSNRLSFAACLVAVATKSVARRCSRKQSKSTLAHDQGWGRRGEDIVNGRRESNRCKTTEPRWVWSIKSLSCGFRISTTA